VRVCAQLGYKNPRMISCNRWSEPADKGKRAFMRLSVCALKLSVVSLSSTSICELRERAS
jgi:hypothetical protein